MGGFVQGHQVARKAIGLAVVADQHVDGHWPGDVGPARRGSQRDAPDRLDASEVDADRGQWSARPADGSLLGPKVVVRGLSVGQLIGVAGVGAVAVVGPRRERALLAQREVRARRFATRRGARFDRHDRRNRDRENNRKPREPAFQRFHDSFPFLESNIEQCSMRSPDHH